MRLLTRFAGLLTLVAPIVIFAIWGASYVYACFDKFLSPGKPLDVALSTPGGDVRLKASRYSISLWQGALIADNVKLYEPDGTFLAGADRITATLSNSDQGWDGPLNVRVRGLKGTLNRNADRSFSVMRYLPKPTEERSKLPFLVDIDEAKITVVDAADGGLLNGDYGINNVRVDGIGEEWVASLILSRANVPGKIEAHLRQQPDVALTAQLSFDNAEGADFIKRLPGVEELKDEKWPKEVAASSLVLNGRAQLTFPAEGDWKLDSDVTVQGANVRYGSDWFAEQTTFQGKLRQDGLVGIFKGIVGKQPVTATARADWSDGLRFTGQTTTRVAGIQNLPASVRKLIPPAAKFDDASYDGWVAYDPKAGTSLSGVIKAASMSWNKEVIRSPVAKVGYAHDKFVADVHQGVILGGTAKGLVEYEQKTGRLAGRVDVDSVDLGVVGKKYLDRKMLGHGDMSALLGGTTDKLEIELRAHGRGNVAITEKKISPTANIEFGGLYTSEGLDIRRLKVYTGETAAMLTGHWDAKDGALSVDGSVRRLQLEDWLDNATGTANAELTIDGNLDKPKLSGYAEVYAANIYDYALPFASGDFEVAKDKVTAENLLLTRGASKVRGQVAYAFEDGGLQGKLSGESIQLAEWVSEDVSGLIDFKDALVSGTLENPKVEAKLLGDSILIQGVLLDSGEANVVVTKKAVDLTSMSLQGDAGTATGKGFYNFETKSGQVEADLDKVVLSQVLPDLPEGTRIDGTLRRVRARAEFGDGKVKVGNVRGNVSALSINQTPLGQGTWSLHVEGDEYSATIRIGQIDAYIEADGLKYNTVSKETGGEVYVKGFPVRDLYLLARPYMTVRTGQTEPPRIAAPPELIDQLDRFQGRLNAGFVLSGTTENLNVECPDLTVEKMELNSSPAGELATAFTRKNQVWNIDKFNWTGGPGNMKVTGKVDEHGDLELDGEIKNFKPAWLATVMPDTPSVPGEATISFFATGPTKSPVIHASLDGEILSEHEVSAAIVEEGAPETATPTAKTTRASLGVLLDTIEIEQGLISVNGRMNYGGLQGQINATIPFEYPLTIPADKPINAKLDFGKRNLNELQELIPGIDQKRTDGDATASLTITGTKSDLNLNGMVSVQAKSLGFTAMQTYLKDVEATAKIDEEAVQIDAVATSSRPGANKEPGKVTVTAKAGVKSLVDSLNESLDLLSVPVNGSITLDNFAVNENLQEKINGRSEPRLKGSATADGKINVTGTLKQLSIASESPIRLTNVDGTFISAFEGGKYSPPNANAPHLAIDFIAGTGSNPADVKVANAVFAMYGQGRIEGTTDQPNANATMTLSSGTIRLPNARVAMDEGGTLRFVYRGGNPDQALTRLDVDLTGRTNISARGSTGLIERYDVRLGVTGNLLEESGQRITATSEPGDLSQQKILALLGQSQIFEGLNPTANSQEIQKQLQQALGSVALPAVFDAVTAEFARSVGLDYLNFEYNGYEGLTVAFARTLGKNLTLQGRRQVQPLSNEKLRFDLSLIYRPFQRKGSFRNISFTAGLDQDRPYKIGIEYSIRF